MAEKSSDMQPFLDAWDKKMAEVNVFVEQHKASLDSSSSSSSGPESSDDDDDDSVGICGECEATSGGNR